MNWSGHFNVCKSVCGMHRERGHRPLSPRPASALAEGMYSLTYMILGFDAHLRDSQMPRGDIPLDEHGKGMLMRRRTQPFAMAVRPLVFGQTRRGCGT